MGGSASRLPDDALGLCASWSDKGSFLSLREVSAAGKSAARRAIALRTCRKMLSIQIRGKHAYECRGDLVAKDAHPRAVEALGRVFGAGCAYLRVNGSEDPVVDRIPRESIDAIRSFVTSYTNGGLRELSIEKVSLSSAALVELCQASPKLTRLHAPARIENCIKLLPSDAECVAISTACPELNDVSFANTELSPAETWSIHFPNLRCFCVSDNQTLDYVPTRLDAISAAARSTNATELDVEACHVSLELIDAIVGTPLGDRIERFGEPVYNSNLTDLEPEAVLAAARGFPRLRSLTIPEGSTMGGPDFYAKLARANPGLKELELLDGSTTDACIVAACENLSLERLTFEDFSASSRIVDGILAGETRWTLRWLRIDNWGGGTDGSRARAVDVLRLVRGCPKLKGLDWYESEYRVEMCPETCDEIARLLNYRGGRVLSTPVSGHSGVLFECDGSYVVSAHGPY